MTTTNRPAPDRGSVVTLYHVKVVALYRAKVVACYRGSMVALYRGKVVARQHTAATAWWRRPGCPRGRGKLRAEKARKLEEARNFKGS